MKTLRRIAEIFLLSMVLALIVGLPESHAYADGPINVAVGPYLSAIDRFMTPFILPGGIDPDPDARSVRAVTATCLGKIDRIRVMPEGDKDTHYTIHILATAFKKQVFMIGEATNSSKILTAVNTAYLYPSEIGRKLCGELIRPLVSKLLNPPPPVPESAETLYTLISGIGLGNTASYEAAFPALFKVLADNPKSADAQFWIAHTFVKAGHDEAARLHADEFIAAFPNDPRRHEIETLVYGHSDQNDRDAH